MACRVSQNVASSQFAGFGRLPRVLHHQDQLQWYDSETPSFVESATSVNVFEFMSGLTFFPNCGKLFRAR